ncbi:hypothetical protein AAVH_22910 [Aphelenchoides avenae]|nr:hypothetical protein AAVH_22910 [Aphelenchus avenae]
MLPLELLKATFDALSRDDLDALMLTNVQFRDIVLCDFAKEPLRYFATLIIREHQCYRFDLNTGNKYICEDNDDFMRRMRLARIGELSFPTGFVFDEDIFEVLLPFKKTWRDGKLDAPEKFASTSLFERAFSELFFCHDMYVTTDIQQLSQPFTSLPAVRECTSLDIVEPPSTLTAIDIIEWLNADASSEEPKRLEANHHELGGTVEDLIQLLKTDFIESKTARCYVAKIWVDEYDGNVGRFVNNDTSEDLTISLYATHDLTEAVKVERKPVDLYNGT